MSNLPQALVKVTTFDHAPYRGGTQKVYMVTCEGEFIATLKHKDHLDLIIDKIKESKKNYDLSIQYDSEVPKKL